MALDALTGAGVAVLTGVLGFLAGNWSGGLTEFRKRQLDRMDKLRVTLETIFTRHLYDEPVPVPMADEATVRDCLDALMHEPLFDPVLQFVKDIRLHANVRGQGAQVDIFHAKATEYLGQVLRCLNDVEVKMTGPFAVLAYWWRRHKDARQKRRRRQQGGTTA